MFSVTHRLNLDLLKDLDSTALTKLAGKIKGLQLEFGPEEGFQTAFRTLVTLAGMDFACLVLY